MGDFLMLLMALLLFWGTLDNASGSATTGTPSVLDEAGFTQALITTEQANDSNNSFEAEDGWPQSPEDVDISGLDAEACMMAIMEYFPDADEYINCKCFHMCAVQSENPEDIDVEGLTYEACMLKIFAQFPDADEYVLCKCLGVDCPNQTEEEAKALSKKFTEYFNRNYLKEDDVYLAVFFVLVMFVGTVGNVLVLVTVLKVFKAPSVTHMFISSLAVADLLIVLICVPFRLTDYVGRQLWDLGTEACKVFQFIYVFSFMASVFTLTAMSMERYLVICYPMKAVSTSTPGRAKKIIVIVWIVAVVLSVPSALISGVATFECVMVHPHYFKWQGYYFMYLLIIIFLLPSAVMAFAYGCTGYQLWKSISSTKLLKGEKSKDSTKEDHEIKARIQVIKMLFIIWVMFTVTWGSFLCYHIVKTYPQYLVFYTDGAQLTITNQTLNLLTMANSAVNPVLYAFMSSQFRKGFIKCFSCIPIVKRKYLAPVTSTTGSTAMVSGTALSTVSASVKA